MKLINLEVSTYSLKLFNTGQVTLPKKWRERFKTKNFVAKETSEGLLIQPLEKKKVVFYENEEGFGLYCEEGLPVDDIIQEIERLNGSDS